MSISALLFFLAGGVAARGQCVDPDPVPLTHAPVSVVDEYTANLGSFDSSVSMESVSGSNLIKSSQHLVGTGVFGTAALQVPYSPAVGIYSSAGIDSAVGTIEMWVRSPGSQAGRSVLFSVDGRNSLDGDHLQELVVGETTQLPITAQSNIFFADASGLDLSSPAFFPSAAPRGIAVGDVTGDGVLDLVVAMNYANTQSMPPATTPTPGEVHIFHGPIQKGLPTGPPQTVLEVDLAQGLLLGHFDEHPGLDIIVGSYDPTTPPLFGFTNNGSGGFTPMNFQFFGFTASAEGLAAGDVDNDGVLDVVYGNLGSPPSVLFKGMIVNGDYVIGGSSTSVISSLSSNALGVSISDLDEDGWEDVVLAQPFGAGSGPGRIVIHRNMGNGLFYRRPHAVIDTARPFTVTADHDLNNDGSPDLAVPNWRSGGLADPPTTTSTVFFGPLGLPHLPTFPTTALFPQRASYVVDDAVSVAIGDLNDDGIDDMFFHASRGTTSPVFLLDIDGACSGGVDGFGNSLPSYLINSLPTQLNPAGEGSGVAVAAAGSSAYGTTLEQFNSLSLEVAGGEMTFVVHDDHGRRYEATTPFPPAMDSYSVNGFHHVQAEWSASEGLVELRVGHPAFPAGLGTSQSQPFNMGQTASVFRLGSDPQNANRAGGYVIDDVRVSTVRRSQLDIDFDGVQDDWDNCRFVTNPTQADANSDGIGDSCLTCQPNLGFQGPGKMVMEVCGEPLQGVNPAALRIRCAPASSHVYLFLGLNASPTPLQGGMLVPMPFLASVMMSADATGHAFVPIKGFGAPVPFNVFVQAATVDSSVPGGIALSNAVAMIFTP